MQNYDALKDTWIYQEIKQQIMEEMRAQFLTEIRQSLFEIVEARFPRLLPLARRVAVPLQEVAEVRTLLVAVAGAKGEREARQYLEERNNAPALM